jgi:hypothetical protein
MLFSILLLTGCQEESIEIIEPAPEESFTPTSSVANLITRIALRDGSEDNIISNSSCFSIKLPVTLTVNDTELIIDTQDELILLELLLDEFDDDDDEIQLTFPITIILSDYSEVTISSADALEDYIDSCEEGGLDDDIECVDFTYPLEISTYDPDNQVSDFVVLNNDQQLYEFLDDRDDDLLLSFNFPLTLVLSDGTQVIVTNNFELEEVIEDAKDDCDEDDDFDYDDDDDDNQNDDLKTVLISGEWVITSFINDDSDETSEFTGWIFTFNADGSIDVRKDGQTLTGQWIIEEDDDDELELELIFSGAGFENLSEDWDVDSFTLSQIMFTDDDDEFLQFKKL